MSRRTFFRKLSYFMLPLVALYALPLAVLVRSYEIAPVSIIAARHSRDRATAVYGPAYGNPDKGYKLASIAAHEASIVAVGTSRIMQFRSDFFTDGEREFYNAGGVVSRLFDYRACIGVRLSGCQAGCVRKADGSLSVNYTEVYGLAP